MKKEYYLNDKTGEIRAYDELQPVSIKSLADGIQQSESSPQLCHNDLSAMQAIDAGFVKLTDEQWLDLQNKRLKETNEKLAAYVPQSVSMASARKALEAFKTGITREIDSHISLMPMDAQIDWTYENTVKRNSLLVKQVAGMLGIDDTQLDNLFRAAANYSKK